MQARALADLTRVPRAASLEVVQNCAHPRAQFIHSERLADQLNARIQTTVMDDRVAGVARRKQHLELRTTKHRFIRKLTAVEAAGHDHIRK